MKLTALHVDSNYRILVQANGGDGSPPRSSRSSLGRESSVESSVGGSEGGIASLRGVQWRIKLEVLPKTTSIDTGKRNKLNKYNFILPNHMTPYECNSTIWVLGFGTITIFLYQASF